MKIMEKLTGTAKTKKKKVAIAVGAVIFIGCVCGFLYVSGKGGNLFKPATSENQQNSAASAGIKRPERNPDIMGIVESVSGNEVKILKLDSSSMPGMNRNRNNNSGNKESGNNSGQNNGGNNSERPQGNWQNRQGQAGSGSSGSAARAAMLAELKKKSSGEETIIVPVGIQMTKMGGGPRNNSNNQNSSNDSNTPNNSNNQNGANRPPMGGGEAEATISDLAADKMVMIWLNSKVTDRKVAEFVSIMR